MPSQIRLNLKTLIAKWYINVDDCSFLGKEKFRDFFFTESLVHDVIKWWRHTSAYVLCHSNIIAKLENGSLLL